MNQVLGFILSLFGLSRAIYCPYAYHVYHYEKSPKYDPYLLNSLQSKTYNIDGSIHNPYSGIGTYEIKIDYSKI